MTPENESNPVLDKSADTLNENFVYHQPAKQKAAVMVLACGALAREILDLSKRNNWSAFDLQCIPAKIHNHPEKIPGLIKAQIEKYRNDYQKIYVAFADCGTGGLLDKMLKEEGIERLPGAHCYAFYSGLEHFEAMHEEEIGSFYLTDFFVRHFEALFVKPYKLDKHPELLDMMFQHYKRVVYIAQNPTDALKEQAKKHADYLGLEFKYVFTGYGELENSLQQLVHSQNVSFKEN